MPLREAVVAVTYRCNSRCGMCNIWQIEDHEELPAIEYRKLPRTLRTVNVSGGEPFLRKDLYEVVETIHNVSPEARIVFSSNGYLTEKIVSVVGDVRKLHPRVGVGISIDGMEQTHDSIRGIKGMYTKAMETTRRLKESGINDIRLAMTLMPENISEAMAVYRLATDLGVEFTATVAHNSDIYFRKDDNVGMKGVFGLREAVLPIIESQLKSKHVKDWYRAYHMAGMFDAGIRGRFVSRCEAGSRYVFISPKGDVYPCNVLEEKMFNLKDVSSWQDGMTAEVRDRMKAVVRSCRRDCWMVCNTRSLIISHPVRASSWVLRSKIAAHI